MCMWTYDESIPKLCRVALARLMRQTTNERQSQEVEAHQQMGLRWCWQKITVGYERSTVVRWSWVRYFDSVQGYGTGTGENAVPVSKLNRPTTYANVVKRVDLKLSGNRNKILARAHSLERIPLILTHGFIDFVYLFLQWMNSRFRIVLHRTGFIATVLRDRHYPQHSFKQKLIINNTFALRMETQFLD